MGAMAVLRMEEVKVAEIAIIVFMLFHTAELPGGANKGGSW